MLLATASLSILVGKCCCPANTIVLKFDLQALVRKSTLFTSSVIKKALDIVAAFLILFIIRMVLNHETWVPTRNCPYYPSLNWFFS